MTEPLAFVAQGLNRLLDIKQRLLLVALHEGSMLRRDDPEFMACMQETDSVVAAIESPIKKESARRILAHIRQFNPFNSSDVEENDLLAEVVEDFVNFSRDRIGKLVSRSA